MNSEISHDRFLSQPSHNSRSHNVVNFPPNIETAFVLVQCRDYILSFTRKFAKIIWLCISVDPYCTTYSHVIENWSFGALKCLPTNDAVENTDCFCTIKLNCVRLVTISKMEKERALD